MERQQNSKSGRVCYWCGARLASRAGGWGSCGRSGDGLRGPLRHRALPTFPLPIPSLETPREKTEIKEESCRLRELITPVIGRAAELENRHDNSDHLSRLGRCQGTDSLPT